MLGLPVDVGRPLGRVVKVLRNVGLPVSTQDSLIAAEVGQFELMIVGLCFSRECLDCGSRGASDSVQQRADLHLSG